MGGASGGGGQQGLEILNSAKIRCESCRWFVRLDWELREEPDSRVAEGCVRCRCGCGNSEIAVCVDAKRSNYTNVIQKLSERIANRDLTPFRTWSDGMERLDGSEKIEGTTLIDYAKKAQYRIDPALWMAAETDGWPEPEKYPPAWLPSLRRDGKEERRVAEQMEVTRRKVDDLTVASFLQKLRDPDPRLFVKAAPAPPPPRKPALVKEAPRAINWEE